MSPADGRRPDNSVECAAFSRQAAQAYRVTEPDGVYCAAVFSSPHSGRAYPRSFLDRSRLDPLALRASEDAFVDELFDCAPDHGAPLIAAETPRALVDFNRSPRDLDPAVIDGIGAGPLNPRVAAGLGVIPRLVAEGAPIYHGKIPLLEAKRRLETLHAPYHAALRALVERARARHRQAILFDCHSMPRDALKNANRPGGRLPEIVIGDRFGAAASREVSDMAEAAFVEAGFVVTRNAPFAGGHITQTYGRPSRGVHAIQIEIDRSLYLNESRVEKSEGFAATRCAIAEAVRRLCQTPMARRAMAAE
jgi:N-formylglutamate amidohydrolase